MTIDERRKRWLEKNRKKCIDCGKSITYCSLRCVKCNKIANRGYKWSKESLDSQRGEKNHNWKGNFVSYEGLHMWIRKIIPKPNICHLCNQRTPNDMSNISGLYKRDLNDWEWLCHKCHMIKDRGKKKIYK